MFSENGKISERQLFRMIIVASLGPSLLICPRLVSGFGGVGLAVYLVSALLGLGYIFLMLGLKEISRLKEISSKSIIGNMIEGFFKAIGVARLFLIAAGGLYIITDVVSRILLPRTNELMVLLLMGVALVYWVKSGLECMGRAMEILFYWVLVPILISLVVAVPNVRVNNLGLFDIGSTEARAVDFIKVALIMWFVFTPAELVWLVRDKVEKKYSGAIWKGFGFFWVANILCYGIVLGIYGIKGLRGIDTYPLIKVMQISGVPGDFLRRVDGFMGAFLVVSIFCGICLALVILRRGIVGETEFERKKYYGDMKVSRVHKQENGKGNSGINIQKGSLFSYGIVAVVILSVIFLKGEGAYKEKEVFAGVELERRGFVMSIIMESDQITFEIAENEEDEWQKSSEYVTLDTGSLMEAEELYKENGDKVLDFSHMKILIAEGARPRNVNGNGSGNGKYEKSFDKKEYLYDKSCKENIEYMYMEERFGENILVCNLEGDLKKMTADAIDDEKALAVRIENILKASGKDKEIELYKVYREME